MSLDEFPSNLQKRTILRRFTSRSEKTPALFLDRDGVIIEDVHHISRPEDVKLCSGIERVLVKANQIDLPVIVVTNQSGISRGYFSWEQYEKVTKRLIEILGPSCPITAIYANGYESDQVENSWRKPNPQMIKTASEDLNINLERSILIGDRLSDLQAGASAGLSKLFHVLGGHGVRERPRIETFISKSGFFNYKNYSPEIFLINSLNDFPLKILDKLFISNF